MLVKLEIDLSPRDLVILDTFRNKTIKSCIAVGSHDSAEDFRKMAADTLLEYYIIRKFIDDLYDIELGLGDQND